MSHSIQHADAYQNYTGGRSKKSSLSNFFAWCGAEEAEHHFMWTGIALTSQGAVFFPITMFAMFATGASFWLMLAPIASLAMAVVPNLAGLNTRYTIPIYVLSIIIDVLAIGVALM